ncbi:MAG: cytochrome c-type biogenesis protein CcmH [Betaproteobacteria bacterium]|nr:cytochrome c-type biogenesis protein CcmH [Betaproteobacteria bacterium]
MKHRYLLLVLSLVASVALAKEAPPASDDPKTEAHMMRLAEKLRCLVCQNQTIADSNAELAVDLRRQVKEQIKAGKSDAQIMDYMVQRYGDFVLYQPPFKLTTALLWIGPFVLLGAGLALLFRRLLRRRAAQDEAELGSEERRLVEQVLGAGPQSGGAKNEPRKGGAS